MDTVTKEAKKGVPKIKEQGKKSGKNQQNKQFQKQKKQQMIQLVAIFLAKIFYLKRESYFHYTNKCYTKRLLWITWYIKRFQIYR